MQRRAWMIAIIGIALVALVGLIITFGVSKKEEQPPVSGEEAAGEAGPAPSAVTPGKPGALEFRRLEVDTSKIQAEACLVFTAPLDESGKTHYGDYLAIEPDVQVDIRAQGNRLCLGGLDFAASYQVTLREGLPAASGAKLGVAETVPVELKDRPPIVAFEGGFLLPRVSGTGIPVTTINVDKVELEIVRVSDRLLSQLRAGLVDEQTIYGYDRQTMKDEQGELVWKGTMDVKGLRNEATTTIFPLRQAIKGRTPSVYLLTARDVAKREGVVDPDEEQWADRAAQWVIDTDLGITTYRGTDGLSVFVRSLATAEPVEGVEFALVARDNVELGRAATDRDGRVQFAGGLLHGTGGAEPVVVLAYGKDGDFAYLDLRRSSFDLSDRGVAGRPSPGAIDAFLYTERGIYRPGETVHLVAMLRNREAEALSAPLSITVRRPDGMVYREIKAPDLQEGAATIALELTDTAPRGRWSAAAYVDPTGDPVGRVEFDVQDFVPERLKLTLTPTQDHVAPGEEASVTVDARFLYGAPGSGLEGETELRLARAAAPFAQYKDYQFGLVDDPFSAATATFPISATDKSGRTTATASIAPETDASFPLEAQLTVGMFEPGGRTTREQASIPVFTRTLYLGLKPLFDNNEVGENAQARFSLVGLDQSGHPGEHPGLRYEFVREDTEYQWYQVEGEWRFETVTRDHLIDTGTIDAKAAAPVELGARVGWGTYRVTVSDAQTGAKTSVRFYAGWGAAASADRPDRVAVHADKESYEVGDTARVSIRAPEGGKALVVLAGDKVLASRLVDVPKGGTDVSFEVEKSWSSGAYAIVTLYRPLGEGKEETRAPVRAIGLVWLPVDARDRTLSLAFDAPKVVRPRTSVELPVNVTNARPGEKLKLVLAAVDEGILQLTDYESPAPSDYYFGKRRLGVDIRDDYGRLIKSAEGTVGPIREGGDNLGGRALAVVPTRTVALFSGLVDVGDKGRATVKLAIPDFVGELRLMAVAFGAARIGEASQPLTVRDPVVGEVTLPRFLAPGDQATATLLIDNVEGNFGTFHATVRVSGSLVQDKPQTYEASIDRGERKTFGVPIKAGAAGIGTVRLTLDGPNNFHIERSWPIEVRPPMLPVFDEKVASLDPGAEARLDSTLLQGYLPESASLTLAVAGTRGFDVPALLKWLDRYPYGCLEQTTSRAMPLLYVSALAKSAGLATDKDVKARVQDAIERVIDMQHYSGGFGMWGAMSEPADPWLAVFAVDFLAEARAQGYVVPKAPLDRAFDWLRGFAAQTSQPDAARAYALYVLARAGTAKAGDVRYFYDTTSSKFADVIVPALSAAALAQVGDRARAHAAFTRANEIARDSTPETYNAQRYGSLLRDMAGFTALAASSGEADIVPALMTRTAEVEPPVAYTTTQEKAWLVRAAAALQAAQKAIKVSVAGTATSGAQGVVSAAPTRTELEAGVTLKNTGEAPVWWSATVNGVPETPLPAEAKGITIEKRYFTMDGAPVADLTKVRQSQRFVVSIRGVMAENIYRTMAVLDLLPAGFEIEAVVQNLANDQAVYPWLGPVTAVSVAEGRDDRFVTAFDLGDRYLDPEGKRKAFNPPFSVAYIVRAVTPGTFVLPAAQVEAMYSPDIRARTSLGRLTVTPAP